MLTYSDKRNIWSLQRGVSSSSMKQHEASILCLNWLYLKKIFVFKKSERNLILLLPLSSSYFEIFNLDYLLLELSWRPPSSICIYNVKTSSRHFNQNSHKWQFVRNLTFTKVQFLRVYFWSPSRRFLSEIGTVDEC